mmetsp:Transcript_2071/g.6047  ORF Transcript_2071/g.6047 Transcript_2071/m.6047 type:complete len:246 (-) Transcript_2071:68-805(-)
MPPSPSRHSGCCNRQSESWRRWGAALQFPGSPTRNCRGRWLGRGRYQPRAKARTCSRSSHHTHHYIRPGQSQAACPQHRMQQRLWGCPQIGRWNGASGSPPPARTEIVEGTHSRAAAATHSPPGRPWPSSAHWRSESLATAEPRPAPSTGTRRTASPALSPGPIRRRHMHQQQPQHRTPRPQKLPEDLAIAGMDDQQTPPLEMSPTIKERPCRQAGHPCLRKGQPQHRKPPPWEQNPTERGQPAG